MAYYPYDPIDRPTIWQGLRVDSLMDMTVNKIQAVLTRARPRDFVDLHFLLHEGPERDLDRLLSLARAKFEVGASRVTLAEQLLKVEEIAEPQVHGTTFRLRGLAPGEVHRHGVRWRHRRGPRRCGGQLTPDHARDAHIIWSPRLPD